MNAIDVLRRAGIKIYADTGIKKFAPVASEETSGAKTSNEQPQIRPAVNTSDYVNSDYEAIRMLMGNQNNNNSDPMMNMLPYMLNDNENGKNIDPQVLQSIMMNSMMNSLNSLNSTDNNK